MNFNLRALFGLDPRPDTVYGLSRVDTLPITTEPMPPRKRDWRSLRELYGVPITPVIVYGLGPTGYLQLFPWALGSSFGLSTSTTRLAQDGQQIYIGGAVPELEVRIGGKTWVLPSSS